MTSVYPNVAPKSLNLLLREPFRPYSVFVHKCSEAQNAKLCALTEVLPFADFTHSFNSNVIDRDNAEGAKTLPLLELMANISPIGGMCCTGKAYANILLKIHR